MSVLIQNILDSLRKISYFSKIVLGICVLLILAVNILRFTGLESSPAGFYYDEMSGAAHVVCLIHDGTDTYGNAYPLFISMRGVGGYSTPVYVYGSFVWVQLFGESVASFRSFIVFVSLLGIIGIGLFGLLLGGPILGLFALILATISPWVWQFSRIAWDPPLMSFFIIYASVFLVLGLKQHKKKWFALSGICMSLAMYSYLPARFAIPIIVFCLFITSIKISSFSGIQRTQRLHFAVLFVSLLITSIPLICFLFTPGALQRTHNLFIGNMYFARYPFFEKWTSIIKLFVKQFFMYIDPRYLFMVGDGDLRQGVGFTGIFSWTEGFILAIFLCVVFTQTVVRKFFNNAFKKINTQIATSISRKDFQILFCLLGAAILFVIPAALTGELQPHALRSIGAYPFSLVFVAYAGTLIYEGIKAIRIRNLFAGMLVIISCTYVIWFMIGYFGVYEKNSRSWFVAHVIEQAQKNNTKDDWTTFYAIHGRAVGTGSKYLDMEYRKMDTCGQ